MATEARQRRPLPSADLPPAHPASRRPSQKRVSFQDPGEPTLQLSTPRTDPLVSWFVVIFTLSLLGYGAFWWSNRLPLPKGSDAPFVEFAEGRAMEHVAAIVAQGPHPVGSVALDTVFKYVKEQVESIQQRASTDVEVDLDVQYVTNGSLVLPTGLFMGRTLLYQRLRNIVVRLRSRGWGGADLEGKNAEKQAWHGILVSSHIDSVFTSPGAGDCASCVAVMLETLHTLSLGPPPPAGHALVFLFNEGEEEGLLGAHAFITQHKWAGNIRAAIDLEAMGAGGRSILFQAGPSSWLLGILAKHAPHPAGAIIAQDVFLSGVVKSATDFQVYRQVAGLSGLDFAYMENGATYHTKGDALHLLRPGSLQHSGDNMVALLQAAVNNEELPVQLRSNTTTEPQFENVYYDLLGSKLITYPFAKAKWTLLFAFALSAIFFLVFSQPNSLWALPIALLSQLAIWPAAIASAALVALVLSTLGPASSPCFSHPWLAVGLYAPAAAAGAVLAQGLGRRLLVWALGKSPEAQLVTNSAVDNLQLVAVALQWLLLLTLGTWKRLGVAYLAREWTVYPIFAFLFLERKQQESTRRLSLLTAVLGTAIPLAISADPALRLADVFVQMSGRFDRHPGSQPVWLFEVVVATLVALLTVAALSYLLPYAHRGETVRVARGFIYVTLLFTVAVLLEWVPAYTAARPRGINAVHVHDLSTSESFISIASNAPGPLDKVVAPLGDRVACNREDQPDFTTYQVKYGCTVRDSVGSSMTSAAAPTLEEVSRSGSATGGLELTLLLRLHGRLRWAMALKSSAVKTFAVEAPSRGGGLEGEGILPARSASSKEGWHIIQFASGRPFDGERLPDFLIKLHVQTNSTSSSSDQELGTYVKLRVDDPTVTEDLQVVLDGLPAWVTQFGKSTSPYTLAYTTTLDI